MKIWPIVNFTTKNKNTNNSKIQYFLFKKFRFSKSYYCFSVKVKVVKLVFQTRKHDFDQFDLDQFDTMMPALQGNF